LLFGEKAVMEAGKICPGLAGGLTSKQLGASFLSKCTRVTLGSNDTEEVSVVSKYNK
jgi:hypothetical protein